VKIAILNGNPDSANQVFDRYLVELKDALSDAGHSVTLLMLRDMDIEYCVGCFGCWVKTPGECVARDESAIVCREMINSRFVLWASPIIMGFASALLKKMVDKMIPLVHPYFVMSQGVYRHRARYERYPLFGALWEKRGDTDDRDIEIVNDIFGRTALNFKSRLALTCLTSDPVQEMAGEIKRL
jgi:multimeric flavodoxin WrbA